MIRRLVAVAALCSGLLVLVTESPASAAELQAASWWSRTATTDPLTEVPGAALPAPNPTSPDTIPNRTVPEGQLLVEGTPEGATAIAAITWRLRSVESSPSLVLPIGPGSTVNAQSVILACRSAVRWTPPEVRPGKWSQKPVTDSRACINGVIADDGSTVGFGLQPLINGSDLDITLVPGRISGPPEGADGSAFRWVFPDPPAEALSVVESNFTPGADPVVVTTPTTAAPAPVFAPPPTTTASVAPVITSPPVIEPDTLPPPTVPAGDSSALAAPALEASDLGQTIARAPISSLPSADASSRFVGIVLLGLALAAGAWSFFSPPPPEAAMVGLGRFRRPMPGAALAPETANAPSTEVSGGLSRFAKPRREPPVPLV